jgi:hypothetical protein
MSWTFVTSGHTYEAASASTIAVTLGGIHLGDMVLILVKWENLLSTASVSDGMVTIPEWLLSRVDVPDGSLWANLFILPASQQSGFVTYTATITAPMTKRSIVAMAYTPPPGTVYYDGVQLVADVTMPMMWAHDVTTAFDSSGPDLFRNAITMSKEKADGVAFGFFCGKGDHFTSGPVILGVTPDRIEGNYDASNGAESQYEALWAKAYTQGFSSKTTGTLSGSAGWVAGIVAMVTTPLNRSAACARLGFSFSST